MSKQTATEWLFAHLLPFLEFSDPKEREHFRKCLAEAKAMEKEQIVDAYVECYMNHVGNGESILREANSVYTKTYGGDK
jgi:uncharacterized protein YbaA (DUF1428 family)